MNTLSRLYVLAPTIDLLIERTEAAASTRATDAGPVHVKQGPGDFKRFYLELVQNPEKGLDD